ncbi:MAG: transglycosylase domain-containing protein [Candidatus Dactylopiibacterium sp.]|nr:transglycosylase domain-containing protein [Candidatus Dactylopiibacterium sp.]
MKFRALFLAATLACAATAAQAFTLPGFAEVRASHLSSDALLLDRSGRPLADLRIARGARRLDWVPLTALSPAMREALIAAEDRRFFSHGGIDWLAFGAAAWQNIWGQGKRGASTLTMQLAGLLDPELRLPPGRGERRSLAQKWDQSRAAIELEAHWTKAQILEAYLNLAPFRGDLQGIGAASELIFGLPASALSPREASLLAALLRGPNATPAVVTRRACQLLDTLKRRIPCAEVGRLASSRLDAPRNQPRHAQAPHLARLLLKQPGQRVATTLDGTLQERLRASLALHDSGRAAAVLLDNANAEVLAWIGARDAAATDGVTRAWPLADWWWPAATTLALEQRQLTAATPLALPVLDARDARLQPPPWVSLRVALGEHLPVAASALQATVASPAWPERLRALGMEAQSPAFAAPSLLQLAASWRSLASGNWQGPRWLPATPEATVRRLWRADASFIAQDILTPATTPGRPRWASLAGDGETLVVVGGGARYTLALAAPLREGERLWDQLLQALGDDPRSAAPPEGVVSGLIRFEPPAEPPRREWFLEGSAVELVTVLPDGRAGVIRSPATGAVVTLASGRHAQYLILQAAGSVALRWWVNGSFAGQGERVAWQATPGRHQLLLTDADGRRLDSAEFEVRTEASPAPAPADPSETTTP